MTELLVLSKREVENYNFQSNKKYGIVSITNRGNADFEESEKVKAVRANFGDYDDYNGMTEIQAIEIASFIKDNFLNSDVFIVHCEAGISRSSGIAGAIAKYYFKDDSMIFYNPRFSPNMRCYRMVLNKLL